LFVAAWGQDPCCDDIGGAPYAAGALAAIDRKVLPIDVPLAAALGPVRAVDPPAAAVLLQALLLRAGAVEQIITRAQVDALRQRWAAVAPMVDARPAGLFRDESGYRLWLWIESRESGMAADCHYLNGWGARLSTDGVLSIDTSPGSAAPERHTRFAEGEIHGEPCE
jgi:hypothetical protein